LKKQEDIKFALKQTTSVAEAAQTTKPKAQTRDKISLSTFVVLLLAFGALDYLVRSGVLDFLNRYVPLLMAGDSPLLPRLTRGAIFITLVLAFGKLIEIYLIGRLHDAISRYNLKRILNLFLGLTIAFILVSVIFVNWYTAVVSLGLLSLILGFALQTPITSFIGWIYILTRKPYQVGDRIQLGEVTGDVISVSYLDTTLWEFGGKYLSTDHPSGRIIKIPNANILSTAVINYSWPLFPYIWNEVKFQIAYSSDLEFVAKTMQEVAAEELGEEMMDRVRTYRELLAQTPVDQLEVREYPSVVFRVSENTWVEAIVRYLVYPREAGRIKNRLIKKLLTQLNAEPERVQFPKGDAR
jgi:small-conductance mechanosensitive channel